MIIFLRERKNPRNPVGYHIEQDGLLEKHYQVLLNEIKARKMALLE